MSGAVPLLLLVHKATTHLTHLVAQALTGWLERTPQSCILLLRRPTEDDSQECEALQDTRGWFLMSAMKRIAAGKIYIQQSVK